MKLEIILSDGVIISNTTILLMPSITSNGRDDLRKLGIILTVRHTNQNSSLSSESFAVANHAISSNRSTIWGQTITR